MASSIDTSSLITKLVASQQGPITALTNQENALKTTKTGITTLETKLAALDKLAKQLSDPNQAASYTASSSSSGVGVTTTGTASAGQYNVNVAQLASAQRTYSDPVSSETQSGLFGSGTMSLQVGSGAALSIAITASDTLDSVASKISQSGTGTTANVMFDGTGYRLQISGPGTGAANTVTFSESGTTLGLTTASNTVSQAHDAIFSVDGFTVKSASNHVTQALAGVALDLSSVTSGASYDAGTNKVSGGIPASITVSSDPASLKAKITSFVGAYNDVINQVSVINQLNNGVDSVVRAVQSTLQRVIGQPLSGLTPSMQALSQIGITTNRDGTLATSDAKLDNAIASNAGGVTALFVKSSASSGMAAAMDSAINLMTDSLSGSLVLQNHGIDKQTAQMDKTVTAMQASLTAYQDRITQQFNDMETALSSIGNEQTTVTNFAALFTKQSSS